MPSYIISYDLTGPGRDYQQLYDSIEGLDYSERLLESVWLVESVLEAKVLRDQLAQHIDADDRLLIVRSGGAAAWRRLLADGDAIKGHFR